MAGESLNTVRVLLDHSHPLMNVRYAHLSEDATAAAVAKLCKPKPEAVVQLHEPAKISGNQRG